MYKGLSTTPFNDFFVLQTVIRTRGHTAKLEKKEADYIWEFETTFLLRACSRPMEWFGSVHYWFSICECIQKWFTANARQEHGLLHGLIWSAWPYRLHRIQRFFFGSAAAVPGKSPGKSATSEIVKRPWACVHRGAALYQVPDFFSLPLPLNWLFPAHL